jgi:hypothetical protein
VKYSFKLKQTDVFEMVGNILLYQKDTKHQTSNVKYSEGQIILECPLVVLSNEITGDGRLNSMQVILII